MFHATVPLIGRRTNPSLRRRDDEESYAATPRLGPGPQREKAPIDVTSARSLTMSLEWHFTPEDEEGEPVTGSRPTQTVRLAR